MSRAPADTLVVRTGAANVASVIAGLERLGLTCALTDTADHVLDASRVVLPGVGAFEGVARSLHDSGVAETLHKRIDQGRPTLAVCLGMQLLFESSDEGVGAGLGVAEGRVRRFDAPGLRVPQMGWNLVRAPADARFLTDGYAYFANSYRVTHPPSGWSSAIADHAGPFVAAIERDAVLACQFHPELSGAWGRSLLERWVARSRELEAAPC